MSTTANELLIIMALRLKMQEEGIIFPMQSVCDATKELVAQLDLLLPEEEIDVEVLQKEPIHARYIRKSTGQVLAEIFGKNTET